MYHRIKTTKNFAIFILSQTLRNFIYINPVMFWSVSPALAYTADTHSKS